jgi:cyclopropane fatty-acyl-phospholipid synthase-like methyltransferase
MRNRGFSAADLRAVSSVDQMLDLLNAEYLTEGLDSLRSIAGSSVDFIWSHAVLEHIRRNQVEPFFRELRRIINPAGRMSHRIDFMDHLGGALNNLRFSDRVWESEFMAQSGFYTNRIRSAEMQQALRNAGFALTAVSVGKWERLPTPLNKLAPPYRNCAEDDLLTSYIDVLAEPAPL